jgi:hypothetical protein
VVGRVRRAAPGPPPRGREGLLGLGRAARGHALPRRDLARSAAKACCAYLALVVVTIVLVAICNALPTAESPLFRAVRAGVPADVAALLREGADPQDGLRASVPLLGVPEFTLLGGLLRAESPLLRAAANGHMAVVKALLEAGARPEAGKTLGPLGALVSTTPLYTAAQYGRTAAVQALLEAGARPEARSTVGLLGALWSTTPLYMAAEHGHTAAVAALLEAGAWPEAGGSLLFGLLPVGTPLAKAEASETSNEATRAALRAAVAGSRRERDVQRGDEGGPATSSEAAEPQSSCRLWLGAGRSGPLPRTGVDGLEHLAQLGLGVTLRRGVLHVLCELLGLQSPPVTSLSAGRRSKAGARPRRQPINTIRTSGTTECLALKWLARWAA